MSDEKEGEKKEGEEAAPKPKSKKKLIIIIAVVVALLLGGGGFFFLHGSGGSKDKKEEKSGEEERHLGTAEIPTIVVNLSESASFLKVSMLIEYDMGAAERMEAAAAVKAKGGGSGGGHAGEGGKEGGGGLPPLLARREPMIKDAIIKVLSSKKADELLTVDGKEKLKEELVEGMNEASGLEEPIVVSVYFTEFIIQ